MSRFHLTPLLGIGLIVLLGGCATRPVNPPITQVEPSTGYRYEVRQSRAKDTGREALVILAFSGGGTRAAAFSYGVLEFLGRTRIADAKGRSVRLLDEVDIITGVSGGSFTALAYGLYGEKLFDDYETRFLKRDVQGEIISRRNLQHEDSSVGSAVHRFGGPTAPCGPGDTDAEVDTGLW